MKIVYEKAGNHWNIPILWRWFEKKMIWKKMMFQIYENDLKMKEKSFLRMYQKIREKKKNS